MYKGYKIRLFPSIEQEQLMWKHINACRFIWNYMLNLQEENYKNGIKIMSGFDMVKLLPNLKKDAKYSWLQEVSSHSLDIVCCDLYKAYNQYFKKTRSHPKFKSKKNAKKSFPVTQDKKFYFKSFNIVRVPKIGDVKYKSNNIPQGKPCDPRIHFINGKWILTFNVLCENQALPILNNYNMGIDLGIKELATVAYNNDQKIVIHNIRHSKKVRTLEHKHTHLQRVLARKYRTNYKKTGNYDKTKNIIKYEKIDSEISYKLSNIRKNYIHQETRKLVNLLPQTIIMEDLHIHELLQYKVVARGLTEALLGDFIKKMKYKSEWMGIRFVQAEREFPSSKMCSNCGNIKKNLSLSDRIYKCTICGFKEDRDYNAAVNLMRYVYHN